MRTVRSGFLWILMLTIIAGGGYWYRIAESKCKTPVFYDVGSADERFGLSTEEIRSALSDAESLWEDATGKNLFTYKEGSAFKVNFIYDERQNSTDESEDARTTLDEKEERGASVRAQYEEMQQKYEDLKASYEKRVDSYEKKLAAHNASVAEWNTKGGAPKEVFESLEKEGKALARESEELNQVAKRLNDLTVSVNALGEKGNKIVADYNKDVAWYNSMFATEREFTQGEYHGDSISIYQFDDGRELRRVLAHEFGHALSLDHVEGDQSIMHAVMEGKSRGDIVASSFDLAEFARMCGE